MLTRFGVSGFKAISEEVSIEIRPITLLFGPNSAGKSSILQSMLVLHEILQNGAPDVHRTAVGGATLDVGGLHQFIHRGDTEEKVAWSLSLRPRRSESVAPKPWNDMELEIRTEAFELDPFALTPDARRLTLDQNITAKGSELLWARLREEAGGPRRTVSIPNTDHPLLVKVFTERIVNGKYAEYLADTGLAISQIIALVFSAVSDGVEVTAANAREKSSLVGSEYLRTTLAHRNHYPLIFLTAHMISEELLDVSLAILQHLQEEEGVTGFAECLITKQLASNEWKEVLLFWDDSGLRDDFGPLEAYRPSFRQAYQELFVPWVDDLLKESHAILNDFLRAPRGALDDVSYLGPMRAIPERNEAHVVASRTDSGFGQDDWGTLVSSHEVRDVVNEWLGDGKLGTSLQLRAQRLLLESDVQRAVEEAFKQTSLKRSASVLAETLASVIPVGATNHLLDVSTGTLVGIRDVGFGIGQVLPVIARAVGTSNRLHLIEQPEIHLHPALQAELADVFVAGVRGMNNRFILETHSEHLILRLLRRIRQTTNGTNPEGLSLSPADVAVHYVSRDSEGLVKVARIGVSEDGEFLDPWPNGFFPEGLEELGG